LLRGCSARILLHDPDHGVEDLDVYLHIACSQLASSDRVRLIPLFAVCLPLSRSMLHAISNKSSVGALGPFGRGPRSRHPSTYPVPVKSGPEGSPSGPQKLFRVRAAFHAARFHRTLRAMIGHISRGRSAARISSDETDAQSDVHRPCCPPYVQRRRIK
jgi:hypothetical protein